MANTPGLMRGLVVDVMDPLNNGRLRVRLPTGMAPGPANGGGDWAPSCAGNVKVGDTVIIGFENGDVARPIVLGKISP